MSYDQIIQSIIGILAIVLSYLFVQIKIKFNTWLEHRTTSEQRDTIHKIGEEAFAYAQTVFKEMDGPQKLDAAYSYLSSRLKELGISLTDNEIRAVIEKAYLAYKTATTQPNPPNPITIKVPVEKPIAPEVQQLIDAAKAVTAAQTKEPQ